VRTLISSHDTELALISIRKGIGIPLSSQYVEGGDVRLDENDGLLDEEGRQPIPKGLLESTDSKLPLPSCIKSLL